MQCSAQSLRLRHVPRSTCCLCRTSDSMLVLASRRCPYVSFVVRLRLTLSAEMGMGRDGHGGVSPGPASPSKRRDQERAAITHGTCRTRMPPIVPARSLLCGGADVLACIIHSAPKTRQIGAWKTARLGKPRWPSSPMRFECKGAGSCAWGVMPSRRRSMRFE